MIIKASGERCADSGNLLEVGNAGTHHPLEASEMLEQLTPLGGAEPGDDLQHGLVISARAFAAMPRDREPVGLVPDALHEA